jgi:hypothetical protein
MISLLLSLCIINNLSCDSLSISTNYYNLNSSKDSMLYIDVVFKNVNRKKFLIRKLNSTSKGDVCVTQEWAVLIYHNDINDSKDSLYSPPTVQCHLREEPYLILRKNEEYYYKLLINFKNIEKGDFSSFTSLNYDSGEFEIQLILKMENTDTIKSNRIKINYISP